MSAILAVAAALGLVGVGMLVSPELGRVRRRLRRRRDPEKAASAPSTPPAPTSGDPPTLHVIHGDGATVVPFPQRQAETFASSPRPYGVDGPDAA